MWCSTYEAERRAFGKHQHDGLALADARTLVEKYLPEWTVRRTYGGHGGSWCYQNKRLITLSPDAGKNVVLHEIAHALEPDDRGHGLAYQLRLLELIETEMGAYWMRRLRAQLIKSKSKGHKTHRQNRAVASGRVREVSG